MSASSDLSSRLHAIVAESLDLEPGLIDADTCSKTTPEWDSLAHLVIIDAIERAFRVKLPRLAAYTVKNVGELERLVATQVQHAASSG